MDQNRDVTEMRRWWALSGATLLAAAEAVALLVVAARHGGRAAPLVVVMMVVKLPFCLAMAARRPGAYLTIWLYEVTGLVTAVAKPHLATGTRVLEAAIAGACIALLVAAAPTFPHARLPESRAT